MSFSFESTQNKIKTYLKNADDRFNHLYYFSPDIIRGITKFIPSQLNFNNKHIVEFGIGGGYFGAYLFNNFKIKRYIGLDANLKSLNITYQKLLFWRKLVFLTELTTNNDYCFKKYNKPKTVFCSFVCIQQFPNEPYTKLFFENLNKSDIEELFFQVRENEESSKPIFYNSYDIEFRKNNYLSENWICELLSKYNLILSRRSNTGNNYLYLYFILKNDRFKQNTSETIEVKPSEELNISNEPVISEIKNDKIHEEIVKMEPINIEDEITNLGKQPNNTNNPIIDPVEIEKNINISDNDESETDDLNIDERLEEMFKIPFIHYTLDTNTSGFEKLLKITHFYANTNNIFYNQGQKPMNPYSLIGDINTPILVIGNSPSIKDYNLGDIINKFPNVVRINDWTTKGYEKQIGTKTDLWISCGSYNTQVINRKPSSFKKLISLMGNTRDTVFYKSRKTKTRLRVNKLTSVFHCDPIILGYNSIGGRHCLTTGNLFLLILCGLEYRKIFIHGINLDYKGKNQRYFSNKALAAPHNMKMERGFLDYIINRCNIKRLTDCFPERNINKK